MVKRVWWSVLKDRGADERSQEMLLRVAQEARGRRILTPYGTTDLARNTICDRFVEYSENARDTLVMLDMDHEHPTDIVAQLAAPDEYGVHAALSFMRTRNQDDIPWPLAMNMVDSERYDIGFITAWPPGAVIECDFAAPCAMAIQRWVLVDLKRLGYWPFWRYLYDRWPNHPAEDFYFALSCWKAGIHHYVNTNIVTPHMRPAVNDLETWTAWTTVPALRAIVERRARGG